MRRAAAFALAFGLAATAAPAQPPAEGRPERQGRSHRDYADPSAVIAADLALGRLAREKGQWETLRKAAAAEAVWFAPRPVAAAAWLKRQAEPAVPARWQPRMVWMSCDGAYAVSRGAWTRGGEGGEYLAVWERQKKGEWKWLVREEAPPADLGEAPEMISGQVAECSGLSRRRPLEAAKRAEDVLPDPADAVSRDGSLKWSVAVGPDCARTISIEAWNGTGFDRVYHVRRAPPAGGCG
jgi:hypothetical protein